MISSVNHPWGYGQSAIDRYGDFWANLDFTFNDNLRESSFKRDFKEINVGTLHVGGSNIRMSYKELIDQFVEVRHIVTLAHIKTLDKNETFHINVHHREFKLKKHEISKLYETLDGALTILRKKYALGLYL